MADLTVDCNKYVTIGLHPDDHQGLTDEDIKALDAKLAMTLEQRKNGLADAFDAAIERNKARQATQ